MSAILIQYLQKTVQYLEMHDLKKNMVSDKDGMLVF